MLRLRTEVEIETFDLTDDEERRVELARFKIEKAINSVEFKSFVLGYSWDKITVSGFLWWKKYHSETINHFASTKMSNLQVYDHIMSGAESLTPFKDQVIKIYLRIDRRNKRGVLGYTYPNSKWQWVYNWFFRSGTVSEIAGNIGHEGPGHKMGFEHDYKYTQRREFSVPYAIGYFIRDF